MGRPILTPQEMRAAEADLFSKGTDSFDLMQRAGNAVAEFVHAKWPEGRIQVLCGPGGNGGDGFIAAAKLAKLWREVEVFCLVGKEALTGDAAKAAAEWDGEIKPLETALEAPHDIVLDALFGGGLARPLDGIAAKLAERGGRVVSIDVPSGIDGESAKPLGPCFRAEGTITFAALRPAHVLLPGAAYCGGVFVSDIGVPVQTHLLENSPLLWGRNLPQPGQGSHKHARGHLAVVSGNAASTGAARLAGRAGLRAGAGLVTLLSPPDAVAVNASHLTAIMLKEVANAEQIRETIESASTVILGPAAGINTGTRKNVECLLSTAAKAVLDADALTVFADDQNALYKQLRTDDLITPHVGEFKRIFGDLLDTEVNKVEATRKAAQMAGCVVLLKGPDTVIAKPDGMAIVNTHATRWLATAGSGDVLAGIAGGLMAQGVDTFTAAAMASWLHGEAGRRVGAGLISEDLEAQLPDILSALHGEHR
ncbi:NAD(P)H-hydrate dehydratase [Hyphomonas sp.]|uniref:NAD(P)H-hydrate dehydratase n=1 Tax=Hyphomonas sp. TaxID=87 RepID=UPI0032D98810